MLSDRFPPSSVSQSCRLWGLRGGGHGFWAAIPCPSAEERSPALGSRGGGRPVPTFHVGLSFPNLWVKGGKTAALIMHLLFRPPAAPAASVGIKRFQSSYRPKGFRSQSQKDPLGASGEGADEQPPWAPAGFASLWGGGGDQAGLRRWGSGQGRAGLGSPQPLFPELQDLWLQTLPLLCSSHSPRLCSPSSPRPEILSWGPSPQQVAGLVPPPSSPISVRQRDVLWSR